MGVDEIATIPIYIDRFEQLHIIQIKKNCFSVPLDHDAILRILSDMVCSDAVDAGSLVQVAVLVEALISGVVIEV